MPLPGDSAGRGGRPRWPLAAAWAASVASLLVIALLPRAVAHAYGTLLLAGSAGALIVVLVYARLLRRSMAPPRAVLLVGGPWEGRMLLARAGAMPEEIQLAGLEAPPCSYRRRAGDPDRPQLRVLRYEPADGPGPGPGGRSLADGACGTPWVSHEQTGPRQGGGADDDDASVRSGWAGRRR